MSHLEERLEHDLTEIRDQIASMGSSVEQALNGAFRALHDGNEKLAFTTILSDLPINRQMRKIDQLCHVLYRGAPAKRGASAPDLFGYSRQHNTGKNW